MKIPIRPLSFKKLKSPFKYIIIHDITCRFKDFHDLRIDTAKCETSVLRSYEYMYNDNSDINYHYSFEKLKDDYEAIVGRPLNSLCNFPSLQDQYSRSINIIVISDFNLQIPEKRLYDSLSYKLLNPLMFMFKIPRPNILLHREIESGIHCPGNYFNKESLDNSTLKMKVQS